MILFPRTIGPIPIDAVIKETIESKLKITQKPVETGAKITDHAYIEPKKIIIEGYIGGSLGSSSRGGRAVAVAGWQALKALQESRVPFTLISGLDIHKNILIEELKAERDKDNSWVLKFTATLLEIIIVASAYTAGNGGQPGGQAKNLAKGSTTTNASPASQRGDVTSVAGKVGASTPAASDPGSILNQIAN